MKIFKYELEIVDRQEILIQDGARVLCAQVQNKNLYLWAMVDDTKQPTMQLPVHIVGTGNPISRDVSGLNSVAYIGTVQMPPFVWHIFIGG